MKVKCKILDFAFLLLYFEGFKTGLSMNLIASFQHWLGVKQQVPTPLSATRVLTDLQHLCSRFPQGEVEVKVLPGQLTLCFTWLPSASE